MDIINKIITKIIKYKWIFISVIVIITGIVYKLYDPYSVKFFPKCQFYTITGYQCPGCGSQRAIHDLLNLNFAGAVKENFLFVLSIPYLLLGAFFDLKIEYKKKWNKFYDFFFGYKAIIFIFFFIIFFWIIRNFAFYHRLI